MFFGRCGIDCIAWKSWQIKIYLMLIKHCFHIVVCGIVSTVRVSDSRIEVIISPRLEMKTILVLTYVFLVFY